MFEILTPILKPFLAAIGVAVVLVIGWLTAKSKGKSEQQAVNAEQKAADAEKAASVKVAEQKSVSQREVETVSNANKVAQDVVSRDGSAADRLRKSKWNRDGNKGDGG